MSQLRKLSSAMGLPYEQVEVWFANRRALQEQMENALVDVGNALGAVPTSVPEGIRHPVVARVPSFPESPTILATTVGTAEPLSEPEDDKESPLDDLDVDDAMNELMQWTSTVEGQASMLSSSSTSSSSSSRTSPLPQEDEESSMSSNTLLGDLGSLAEWV